MGKSSKKDKFHTGFDITIEELDPRAFNKDIVSKILTQANVKIPEKIDVSSYENWKKQHDDLLKMASNNIGAMQDAGNTSSEIIAGVFSEELHQAYTKFLNANPHISKDKELSENPEIRKILKKAILENIKKDKRYFRKIFIQKGILSSKKYTSLCLHFIQKDFLDKTSSLLANEANPDEKIIDAMKTIKDKESHFIGKHSELKIDPAKYIKEDAKSIMEETLAIFFRTIPDVKKEVPEKTKNAVKEKSKSDKKLDEIGELKLEIAKKLWAINNKEDFDKKKKEIKDLINKNIGDLRAAAEKKGSSPLTSDIESIVHMLRINDLESFNTKFSNRSNFDNFDKKKWIKSLKLNINEKKKFREFRERYQHTDVEPAENPHSSSRRLALFQKKTSDKVTSIKELIEKKIKPPFKKRPGQ